MVIGTVLTGQGERDTTQHVGNLSVGERALHTATRKYHRHSEMLSQRTLDSERDIFVVTNLYIK